MYDRILSDASLPQALWSLDQALLEQTREQGCPSCGGPLDASHYARKPRGGPWSLCEEHSLRLSLCCRREGCRQRVMPPSVRFLGRRVYLSAVVVLGALLRQGPTRFRIARLQSLLGADRRTLQRWRRYWVDRVGRSRQFELLRAQLMPPPSGNELPLSLLECMTGDASTRLRSALSLLSEWFGSRYRTAASRSAELAR